MDLVGAGTAGALIGAIAVFCMVVDATATTAGRFITGALISMETCADTRRTDVAIAVRGASRVVETAGAALRKVETSGASRAAVGLEHPRVAARLAASPTAERLAVRPRAADPVSAVAAADSVAVVAGDAAVAVAVTRNARAR